MNPLFFVPGTTLTLTVADIQRGVKIPIGDFSRDIVLEERLRAYDFFRFRPGEYYGEKPDAYGESGRSHVKIPTGVSIVITSRYPAANGKCTFLMDNAALHLASAPDLSELKDRSRHPDGNQYAWTVPYGFESTRHYPVPARFLKELTSDSTVYETSNYNPPSSLFISEWSEITTVLGTADTVGGYAPDTEIFDVTFFYSVIGDGWRNASKQTPSPIGSDLPDGTTAHASAKRDLARNVHEYQPTEQTIVVSSRNGRNAISERMIILPITLPIGNVIHAANSNSSLLTSFGFPDLATLTAYMELNQDATQVAAIYCALPVFIPGDGPFSHIVDTTIEVMNERSVLGYTDHVNERSGVLSWLFQAGAYVVDSVIQAGASAVGAVLVDGATRAVNFLSGHGLSSHRDAEEDPTDQILDYIATRVTTGLRAYIDTVDMSDGTLAVLNNLSDDFQAAAYEGAAAQLNLVSSIRMYGMVALEQANGYQPDTEAVRAFNAWGDSQAWTLKITTVSSKFNDSYTSMVPISAEAPRAKVPRRGAVVDYNAPPRDRAQNIAAHAVPVWMLLGKTTTNVQVPVAAAVGAVCRLFHDQHASGFQRNVCPVLSSQSWPAYSDTGEDTGIAIDVLAEALALYGPGVAPQFRFFGTVEGVADSTVDVDFGALTEFDPNLVSDATSPANATSWRSAGGGIELTVNVSYADAATDPAGTFALATGATGWYGGYQLAASYTKAEELDATYTTDGVVALRGHVVLYWEPRNVDTPLLYKRCRALSAAAASSSTRPGMNPVTEARILGRTRRPAVPRDIPLLLPPKPKTQARKPKTKKSVKPRSSSHAAAPKGKGRSRNKK
jgi:hypothetical protein